MGNENDLMEKLINAKKVMNKLDSGNYQKGNVDKTMISKAPEELLSEQQMNQRMGTSSMVPEEYQKGNINTGDLQHRVQESKLPDHIKKAMLENPIPQPTLNSSTLDLGFTDKVAEKMEKLNLKTRTPKQSEIPQSLNESVLREIKPLIEHIIESTIERILEQKMKQMESKVTKMNENLHIKVGDSIFTGKITGVKNIKK